jgi:ribosomal-protein-alanine N-acetyltransferase
MSYIRKFREGDLDEVVEIAKTSLKADYDPRLYISIYEMWPDGFFVAGEKGFVVGFLAGISENEEARILMLAVRREFRRRGIGTSLMNAFINSCTLNGIKRVYLEVRRSNAGAIGFYKSLGFSEGAVYPKYYEDGEDAIIMWKTL